MAITFQLRTDITLPVDGARVLTQMPTGATANTAGRMPICLGNASAELGDLFQVSGDFRDGHSIWVGNLKFLSGLGSNMNSGRLAIDGFIGCRAGARMSGGQLIIIGDAADDLGSSMEGGSIFVSGMVGDRVGGSGSGEVAGMRGGTIMIAGNCGKGAGLRMRRGAIVVGGRAGEMAGFQMLAGTLVLGNGSSGPAGIEMKRGTIACVASTMPPDGNRFRDGGWAELGFMKLTARHLQKELLGMSVGNPESLARAMVKLQANRWRLFSGDHHHGGRGEILMPFES